MANLITLSRLLLLAGVVLLAYNAPAAWQLLNVPLLILVFVTDGLDGYVARRLGETSQFGAVFDIACDRIVELTMWIVLSDLGLVPVWVPLVFIIRGVIVDAIRSTQAAEHRQAPFAMMTSPLGRMLVASKGMRIFYAVLKAVAFCWLMLIYPLPELLPAIWAQWAWLLTGIGAVLVYGCVAICIARGAPVVIEYAYTERRSLMGSLGHRI